MSGDSATAVRFSSSCAASHCVAPETTVPVEPPNNNPRRAARCQAPIVSASSTWITSSTNDSSSCGGRTAIPSPGSIRRAGAPPKLTDPAASTATIRTYGRCSLNQRACDRVLSPGFYEDQLFVDLEPVVVQSLFCSSTGRRFLGRTAETAVAP
jgi:hypothetical protein